jgi:hypothetical protein
MDMLKEHPSKERSEVEGMDMMEDMTAKVVKRDHDDVVLVRHWIGDGVERRRRALRQQKELVKLGCGEGHTTFTSSYFNCSILHRVEKRVKMRCNVCRMSSNHDGVFIE